MCTTNNVKKIINVKCIRLFINLRKSGRREEGSNHVIIFFKNSVNISKHDTQGLDFVSVSNDVMPFSDDRRRPNSPRTSCISRLNSFSGNVYNISLGRMFSMNVRHVHREHKSVTMTRMFLKAETRWKQEEKLKETSKVNWNKCIKTWKIITSIFVIYVAMYLILINNRWDLNNDIYKFNHTHFNIIYKIVIYCAQFCYFFNTFIPCYNIK